MPAANIQRARTHAEYVETVTRALFEVDDLRACPDRPPFAHPPGQVNATQVKGLDVGAD